MTLTLDLDNTSDASVRRTLSTLSLAVVKCKKIVVVTGAGISCSCGIPDFRSSDGLYAMVRQRYPDVVLKGRDLFDSSLFRNLETTAIFYSFIAQLKQSIDAASPSPTHHFIKTLDKKRKLLRSYTQNIDGLEERAGLLGTSSHDAKTKGKGKSKLRVKDIRNVQLHGDIHCLRCTFCSAEFPCSQVYLESLGSGVAPQCEECASRSQARLARGARPLKVGSLRPAVVLYNEPHPLGDDIGAIQSTDMARKPDMLIVMGTSMQVHGLKKLVKDFARVVHETTPDTSSAKNAKQWKGKVVLINKTAPGAEWDGIIDYHVMGEADKWVEKVIEDWKKVRPSDWEVQTTLDSATTDQHAPLKVVKEVTNTLPAGEKAGARRKQSCKIEVKGSLDPPSLCTHSLPPTPPSPSKRRKGSNSHEEGEARILGKLNPPRNENAELDEGEMVFGVDPRTTRSQGSSVENEGHGEAGPRKRTVTGRLKSVLKVEVVIEPLGNRIGVTNASQIGTS